MTRFRPIARLLLFAGALLAAFSFQLPSAEAKLAFFRNYPDLHWKVIRTEHFNVFYPVSRKGADAAHPVDAEFTARKTAFIAEEMYPLICGQFNYYLDETINIVMLDQTDELTGYTVPNFDWIVVSARHSDNLWRLRGHHDWLRNVMYHEFAHVVSLKADQPFAEESFGVFVQARWSTGKNIGPPTEGGPPISGAEVTASAFIGTGDPWFWVEGGAEYYTDVAGINTWTSNREMRTRMDILEGTALNFDDMGDYFGSNGGFDGNRHYLSGYAFALYLEERFGEGVYQSFALKRAEQGWTPNWLSVIEDTLNISAEDLFEDYKAWAQVKYEKVRDEIMKEPAIGLPIGLTEDYWESDAPDAKERNKWVHGIEGDSKYKWRKDREASGIYDFHPKMSPDGTKWASRNMYWSEGIEVYPWGEQDMPAFGGRWQGTDEADQLWRGMRPKMPVPATGDGGFDWSPDGKKMVFTCPEDYVAMGYAGMRAPELSRPVMDLDGYDWHTLCVLDWEDLERFGRERMMEFWGAECEKEGKDPSECDPMAQDEERYQKLLRGLDAPAPKKTKNKKKKRRHWFHWKNTEDKDTFYALTLLPGGHRRVNDPAWSPDGQTIAFSKYADGTQNIWITDVETGEGRALTDFTDGTRIEVIDWAPDGSQLVFGAYRWNQADIYVMNADGSGLRPITKDKFEDREPSWGHDGMIYFTSDRVGGIFNAFRLNPELDPGIPDGDLDGVPDELDACPDQPETVNLYRDTDGCPDSIPVRRTKDRIELDEKVYFELDQAVIKPESFELLDAVARLLTDNPQVLQIEVGGHTDSQGEDDYNLELSQRRSEAIVDYLVNKGVAKKRLVAKGYGESVPLRVLADELKGIKDAEERLRIEQEVYATNRRVEMNITAQERVTEEITAEDQAELEARDRAMKAEITCNDGPEAQRLQNAYLVQLTNVVSGAFFPTLTPSGHLMYARYTPFGWKPWGLRCDQFFNKVVDDTTLVIPEDEWDVAIPQEVYPDYSMVTEDVPVHGVFVRNAALIPIIDVGNVSLTHIGVNFGFQFFTSDALDTNEFFLMGFAGEDLMLWGRWTWKRFLPEFYVGGLIRKIKFDYGFNLDEDGSNLTTDDQFLADIKASYLVYGGFAGVDIPLSPMVRIGLNTFQFGVAYIGVTDGKNARPIRHRGNQNVSLNIASAGLSGGRTRINPRGGWSFSLNWSPSFTIPLNRATAGVDADDGQIFESYFYNAVETSLVGYIPMPFKNSAGDTMEHTLQMELQVGLIDRNVPYADEIRGGGGGGSLNTSNPYARSTAFSGYEPWSLSGETVALVNLQYRFPLARNIDKKVGGIYFESVYMQVFATIGNFWSYKLKEDARTTDLFGERVLVDPELRKGGGYDVPGSGIVREWPGMESSENGNHLLVDTGVEIRVAANIFNRSPWYSFFRLSRGWMPVSGRGDVDGDDVYTNSSDPTISTQSDEREPAGFRFYLGIGNRW